MQGLLASSAHPRHCGYEWPNLVTEAFQIADAMLAEAEQEKT
jgi:hypothetical protein